MKVAHEYQPKAGGRSSNFTLANKKKAPSLPIYRDAAKLMAKSGLSLKQAAMELKWDLDIEEIEEISRRPEFIEILNSEKYRSRSELANLPGRDKSSSIGLLLQCAEKLFVEGNYKASAEVATQILKAEGHLGSDSNIQIFAGLSAKDISEAKARLQEEIANSRPEPAKAPLPN